jgi:hypothetical protein
VSGWRLSIVLAACALAVLVAIGGGCAHIEGTVVYLPAMEHEGYAQHTCWGVSDDPSDACCWYQREDSWRLVCTRDGGDTWDLMDSPRADAGLRCDDDWRYWPEYPCETV